MSRVTSRQKPTQVVRRQVSDFPDVQRVSESVRRGDVVVVVSAYPWGLEFEVEAVETVMSDLGEDASSA